MDALAAGEEHASLAMASKPEIVVRAFDAVQIDPAHGPPFAHGNADAQPVAAVLAMFGAGKGQRLETAAAGELPSRFGKEAVEEAVGAILGQIDDAGPRVDRPGLVVEEAHRLQRRLLDEPALARRTLQHPA